MALSDILLYDEGAFGYPGDNEYSVAASATLINAGEPVAKPLGNSTGNVVAPLATNKPVAGTDFMAGVASSTSSNTAAAAGKVRVTKMLPGITYVIAPKVTATWATQALYDALVGARILFDLTSSVYTALAADGSTNGLVVEPLDVIRFPNKVRFSIRSAVWYTA